MKHLVINLRAVDFTRMPAFIIAAVITAGLLFNGFDNARGQAIGCLINNGLLGIILIQSPPDLRFWKRSAPVLLCAVAAFCWLFFVTVGPGGALPDYAPGKLLSFLSGLAALLIGMLAAPTEAQRARLLDFCLLFVCLIFVSGLLIRELGTDALSYWTPEREGRFQGTIGNVNVTATMACAFTLLALLKLRSAAGARAVRRWAEQDLIVVAPYLLAFLLCLGIALLTASRTPVAVLILAMVAGTMWIRRRLIGPYLKIIGGLVVLVGLGLTAQFSDLLSGRLDALPDNWRVRLAMWDQYSSLVSVSPFSGFGAGAFPSVNAHYLTTPHNAEMLWAVNSPHNLLLQLLLAAGIPYLLLLVAAGAFWFRQVLRVVPRPWSDEDVALALMMALILACSMVDIVLDMPTGVTVLMFLAGLLMGRRKPTEVPIALT